MADHIQKGKKGEEEAASFLLARGYQILERNWRSGHKEIDIIAKDSETTVFIEVKSRRQLGNERYDELINPSKQRTLLLAANAYMIQNKQRGSIRFDVIFIIGEGAGKSIKYIENAFDSWG